MPSGSRSSGWSARRRSLTCSCLDRFCCVWRSRTSASGCRRETCSGCRSTAGRLGLANDDAGAESLSVSQRGGLLLGALSERSPALAENKRVHRKPLKVAVVLLTECVEELGASGEKRSPPGRFLRVRTFLATSPVNSNEPDR